MSSFSRTEVESAVLSFGEQSSHFVWLLDHELEFYRCQSGLIFAVRTSAQCLLIVLDPLCPSGQLTEHLLKDAIDELKKTYPQLVIVFIAVSENLKLILSNLGYSFIQSSREPWIYTHPSIPTGNHAKGVRSARNYAIGHSVQVREHSGEQLTHDTEMRSSLESLNEVWQSRNLFRVTGLLPFSCRTPQYFYSEHKPLFVSLPGLHPGHS